MGLDMYLHKVKKEEVAYWRKANAIHAWFERKYQENTGNEGLENCQPMYVSKEDLIELRDTCEKVLKASKLEYGQVCTGERYNEATKSFEKVYGYGKCIKDTSVAEELLPTESGFFFGSNEYGEGYIEDLKDTIKQIDEILKTVDFDEYGIEYLAWW